MSSLTFKLEPEQLKELAQAIANTQHKQHENDFIPRLEGAKLLDMHVNTLDPLIRKGIITSYVVGRKVFVKKSQLLELLEKGRKS